MMIFRTFRDIFKSFFELDQKQCQIFIDIIKETNPTEAFSTLSKKIEKKLNISAESILEILKMTLEFYELRKDLEISVKELVNDIKYVFKKEEILNENDKWENLELLWEYCLLDDDFFGMKAKAVELIFLRENVYNGGRMIIDYRPVYSDGEKSEYGIIIHTFEIKYSKNKKKNTIYLALDSQDLQDLKKLIKREEAKEKSLRVQIDEKEISIIHID